MSLACCARQKDCKMASPSCHEFIVPATKSRCVTSSKCRTCLSRKLYHTKSTIVQIHCTCQEDCTSATKCFACHMKRISPSTPKHTLCTRPIGTEFRRHNEGLRKLANAQRNRWQTQLNPHTPTHKREPFANAFGKNTFDLTSTADP